MILTRVVNDIQSQIGDKLEGFIQTNEGEAIKNPLELSKRITSLLEKNLSVD